MAQSASVPLRQVEPPAIEGPELLQALDEGLDELDRGEGTDGPAFLQELIAETERLYPAAAR